VIDFRTCFYGRLLSIESFSLSASIMLEEKLFLCCFDSLDVFTGGLKEELFEVGSSKER